MNEEEMRQIFRGMRDEPVPADSVARVRAAVDRRVRKRQWLFGWRIAAALVLAGCIVGVFFLLRPGKPVPIERPVTPEIAQVMPPVEAPVLPEIPVRTAPRPKRVRPRPVVEGVPVSIRIETPDPDVVILLVN